MIKDVERSFGSGMAPEMTSETPNRICQKKRAVEVEPAPLQKNHFTFH